MLPLAHPYLQSLPVGEADAEPVGSSGWPQVPGKAALLHEVVNEEEALVSTRRPRAGSTPAS